MSTLASKLDDYRCDAEAVGLNIAISLMYTNSIAAFVVLFFIGEWLGRKRIIVLGLVMMVGGIVLTLFSENLVMGMAGLFIGMIGVQWHFNVSLIYISETVAESHREEFMVVAMSFYGVGCLANTGCYYWLRDWQKVFIYFYVVPGVLLIVAVMAVVTEAPICLIRKYAPEEALEQFMRIARINGVTLSCPLRTSRRPRSARRAIRMRRRILRRST
jgi:MFS family permease